MTDEDLTPSDLKDRVYRALNSSARLHAWGKDDRYAMECLNELTHRAEVADTLEMRVAELETQCAELRANACAVVSIKENLNVAREAAREKDWEAVHAHEDTAAWLVVQLAASNDPRTHEAAALVYNWTKESISRGPRW